MPAGIDRFEVAQIQHFFDAGLAPDVPVAKILDLGREDFADGNPFVFNMAVMGLRLAQRANGVAKLHGVVSRGMFSGALAGIRPLRGAHHLRHQRRARPHLGGPADLRAGPRTVRRRG